MDDRELQSDLQAAVRTLSFARAEKRDTGLMAVGCGVGACVAAVVGLGMTACGSAASVAGIAIVAASVVVLARLVNSYNDTAESMPKAEKQILGVGERIEGGESLSVDAFDRDNLHYLLKAGAPDVAIAVVRILGIVGDRRSLQLLEAIVAREGFAEGIATSFDVGVREAAEIAGKALKERLNRSYQTSRLLRASESGTGTELLRPTQAETAPAPERLLRADPDEDMGTD
jgi:hypothetical protein